MAGTSNDTIFGTNFNFSGGTPPNDRLPSMLLDGQLLIGSTALNAGGTHCNIGTLIGGSGILITNGPGTITITNTGGMGPVTGTTTLVGNTGSATQVGGVINVVGMSGLTTSGTGQTLTISPTLNLAAVEGLSGPGFAVETGVNTWAIRTLMAGTGISITNPQGIAGDPVISVSPSIPLTINTDSGTATPAANVLAIDGTAVQGISTSGTGSTVTITAANATATQKGVAAFNSTEFTVTAGVVASSPITVTAGTGLTGGGSVNLGGTVSIALSVPVSVPNGGTGDTTLTTDGVLYGNGASPVGITAAGINGQVLIGSTGAAPAFATILGTNGITFTTGANALTISNTSIPNSALANSSITLSNGNNITVTGSPVSLGGTATIAVTGTTTHAVQIGNASGSLTSVGVGSNGQVLIGATGADPAFATLTSSDSSITFTTGANTLDLKASVASTTLTKLTPDDGGAVSAVANNINIFGIKDGATAQVTMTHNQSSNVTIENRAHLTPYVVDPSSTIGSRGTFTTIASAIAAAVIDGAPRDIFIKPGVYTENLNLTAGINLTAFSSDCTSASVQIVGKLTFTDTGKVTVSNINITTNSDYSIIVSGGNASALYLTNCYLNASNNTFISYTNSNSSSSISIRNSIQNVNGTQTLFVSSSPGSISMNYVGSDGGLSSVQSTLSSGSLWTYATQFTYPIMTSGAAYVNMNHSYCSLNAVTNLTLSGTGNSITYFCEFDGGGAAAVNIGSGCALTMGSCVLRTTGGNCVIGSGSIQYSALTLIGLGDKFASTLTQNNRSTGPIIQVTGGAQILSGSGSPNGSVIATKGSLFMRTDGTTVNNRAYINTNGTTGWTALTTVS